MPQSVPVRRSLTGRSARPARLVELSLLRIEPDAGNLAPLQMVLALNALGDGLKDALDPVMRK